MRYLLITVGLIAIIGLVVSQSQASHLRCHTGNTLGFVTIRADPPHIVGTLPSKYTSASGYFDSRYNCTGGGVQAKRVDVGTYDVLFPGLTIRAAVATAISLEGVSASIYILRRGEVRVSLRGPIITGDVAPRRDVPFTVIAF